MKSRANTVTGHVDMTRCAGAGAVLLMISELSFVSGPAAQASRSVALRATEQETKTTQEPGKLPTEPESR